MRHIHTSYRRSRVTYGNTEFTSDFCWDALTQSSVQLVDPDGSKQDRSRDAVAEESG